MTRSDVQQCMTHAVKGYCEVLLALSQQQLSLQTAARFIHARAPVTVKLACPVYILHIRCKVSDVEDATAHLAINSEQVVWGRRLAEHDCHSVLQRTQTLSDSCQQASSKASGPSGSSNKH